MAPLPEVVRNAWKDRNGPAVLATIDDTGTPNAVYVTCVSMFGTDKLVIADNFFNKTRTNILAGSKGSLLFITKNQKAYQVKGSFEYHKEGEIFDDMKKWNPQQHPGHAAAVLNVEQVYSGAEQLL